MIRVEEVDASTRSTSITPLPSASSVPHAAPSASTDPTPPTVPRGTIVGRIFSRNKPYAHTGVIACDSPEPAYTGADPCSGKDIVLRTDTDGEGRFRFENAAPRKYDFAIRDGKGWLVPFRYGSCCREMKDGEVIDIGRIELN